MGRTTVWFMVGTMLLWAGVANAGPNQLLNGDYAFTGEASCLVSNAGFDGNLTPLDGRFVISFSVQGVRTFNGDGTGTVQGRTVSFQNPDGPFFLSGVPFVAGGVVHLRRLT